jgi:hypothetical protein
MNIQLSDAEEHIPGEEPSKLGQVFIRYACVALVRFRVWRNAKTTSSQVQQRSLDQIRK